MTQPVVLSASSATTYIDCHMRWWFEYVLAVPHPPSEAQQVGIDVHERAEAILKRAQGVQLVGVLDFPPDQTVDQLALIFERDVLPTYETVAMVEQEFQITVNGVPYSGTVDSVDLHRHTWGDEYVVRDLKTTSASPGSGRYRFNMIGYWLGVREMLGVEPVGLQLDYIVRTKKPYYKPVYEPAPSEQEVAGWAATLWGVKNGIFHGEFGPTGLGTHVCNWCPFKSECAPYQRYTAISPLRS